MHTFVTPVIAVICSLNLSTGCRQDINESNVQLLLCDIMQLLAVPLLVESVAHSSGRTKAPVWFHCTNDGQ